MSAEARWPRDMVARYLTVGGATVDLVERRVVQLSDTPFEVITTCTGCPAREVISYYRTVCSEAHPHGTEVHDPDQALGEAHAWAQAHAATCRAMPKPGGVR